MFVSHGQLRSPRLHESLVEWLEKKEDPEIAQELSKTIPELVTEQELAEIPLLREIMANKQSGGLLPTPPPRDGKTVKDVQKSTRPGGLFHTVAP